MKGNSRTTPAMMKKAWNPMISVSPVAMRREKSERAVWATRKPAPTRRMKAITTATQPTRPISVPMAAKIMSLVSSGMYAGVVVEAQPGAADAARRPCCTSAWLSW